MMIVDDQHDINAFLESALAAEFSAPVELMETHISRIFLVGDRAFKLKRAVKLPYVDFSTPELRFEACKKEVRFNSISAPGLYLGTRKIMRDEKATLAFGTEGRLYDAVVEMVRFDQSCLFDRMAQDGKLTPAVTRSVTDMIVDFHAGVPVVENAGGAANIAGVLDINEAGFATSSVFPGGELQAFHALFRNTLESFVVRLDARDREGKIRRCHGDLHLRNICMFDGAPRLFDCIEFNDQIATVDVLYDLAFLLMDLWHRGFEGLANLVANRYLDRTGDDDGFVLLPFFMGVRAAVRAHVTATQADEAGGDKKLEAEARSYFDLARSFLETVPPRLIAIGGLSGSGKTTAAELLAPQIGSPPGARILESDRMRKAMFSVLPEERLGEEAYAGDVSDRVYGLLKQKAISILKAGGSVIVDAVFDDGARRDAIVKGLVGTNAKITGIWLDLDARELRERVRKRTAGASDATLEVLEQQLKHSGKPKDWQLVDASGSPEDVAGKISGKLVLPTDDG